MGVAGERVVSRTSFLQNIQGLLPPLQKKTKKEEEKKRGQHEDMFKIYDQFSAKFSRPLPPSLPSPLLFVVVEMLDIFDQFSTKYSRSRPQNEVFYMEKIFIVSANIDT